MSGCHTADVIAEVGFQECIKSYLGNYEPWKCRQKTLLIHYTEFSYFIALT